MFGIQDPTIWLAYLLCILCTVFCILYGLFNWNKGEEAVNPEDVKWVHEEIQVDEDLT